MRGGDYMVVAADPDAVKEQTRVDDILGPFSRRLSNGGEYLEIRSHTGRLMNSITYDNDGPWPAAADGSGATLAKIDSQGATEDRNNWTFSHEVGGTPGKQNFSRQDLELDQDNLQFHEVASGIADAFWVELKNASQNSIDLNGLIIASSEGQQHRLDHHVIEAGGYVLLDQTTLRFAPAPNDKMLVYSPNGRRVLDAVRSRTGSRVDRPHTRDAGRLPNLRHRAQPISSTCGTRL